MKLGGSYGKKAKGQAGRAAVQAAEAQPELVRARVTRESDALTLDKGVFSKRSPHAIALSLKRSAERSRRRKSDPYRSAMSMLTFYINRAGKNLPASRKRTLNRAKDELREAFHRA